MKTGLKTVFLIIVDLILLYAALFLVVLYRYQIKFDFYMFTRHVIPFSIVYIIWIIVFYFWDFYTLKQTWDFRDIFKAMFMNGVIAVIFFYIIPYFQIQPKVILLLNSAVYYILFTGWRYLFKIIFRDITQRNAVVIIGLDKHSLKLARSLLTDTETPYVLSAIINIDNIKLPKWLKQKKELDILTDFSYVNSLIKKKSISIIIVNNKWYSELFQGLYHLIHKGIDLYHIASFWELYNKSIPIYTTSELWFLENLRGFSKDLYEKQKRVLDLIICFLLFPVFICLSLFIVFAIRFDSKGPVIYKQKRVGKGNRQFFIYKYRTMVTDAEKHGPQWAKKADPRITRIGKILRVIRLDEMPQFINIIKGDMNLIGPRAERPEFVKLLSKQLPHYDLRHLIRPGLTGWAQVSFDYAASLKDTAKKLEYDLYYLKNRSHLLDIQIFLKTIGTIITRKGR
ncbi:MAG: exopolysaccharide biosynthesis polyprenyl glycosylphosphotransferase [Spirochaetales bacterium]|nr:exopolysaccharide biosynthesis polyprenyl glycosylphosphotransferase [Spirochaetales bacterium]